MTELQALLLAGVLSAVAYFVGNYQGFRTGLHEGRKQGMIMARVIAEMPESIRAGIEELQKKFNNS